MVISVFHQWSLVRKQVRWWRRRCVLFLLSVFLIWYADCLPETLFEDSTSTVLLDRNGKLLGAHIAEDEQWRFAPIDKVPYKYETCLIQFEDRNFYSHFGVSAKGVFRALKQNLSSGKRVSGGSTLTMQLIRLMRKNPPRTYGEKVLEMILATRMEFRHSKKEILCLYASHAPFGNNVVGLEAASWRFFGRSPEQLSWAESATLAVLPNAPGLIYPGRNHDRLLAKRNRLLKRLLEIGKLDASEYELAILEPLPEKPHALPSIAPHLLSRFLISGGKGRTIRCTLDKSVQERVNLRLENALADLRNNEIFNGAVVVSSVETGEILAYVGNAMESGREHANQVNCIHAPRSSGSILKPLLYGKSLESGTITPAMLLQDVPSQFGAFAPKNFAGDFNGLVPADECLSRSLNIPMVHLINQYGLGKFHGDLKKLGLTTINHSARHYGLSLILGGAEVSLYDLSSTYTRMAQQLRFNENFGIHYWGDSGVVQSAFPMDDACMYATFEAMLKVRRPDGLSNWHLFSSSRKVAWKTGTSYGFRDAWAVGVTPDYVVSVWIGNADGEGRPGLTGIQAAAPVLFDVFDELPLETEWFEKPKSHFQKVDVCVQSGHRASEFCDNIRRTAIPKTALTAAVCPYHKRIHLNEEGKQVSSECASPEEMHHVNWFVIPPHIEKFYQPRHPEFRSLPAYKKDCLAPSGSNALAVLYPKSGQKIYLPYDFNGEQKKVVFEATHSDPSELLFWHLDGTYIGQTSGIHQLTFQPLEGLHRLTISDEAGSSKTVRFQILGKKKTSKR